MSNYKVHSYYKKWEKDVLVVDDSTMCTCADLDAAKRVFLGKVSQLTERMCAALNYTALLCGAYVEGENGNQPLSFYIDMDYEGDEENA